MKRRCWASLSLMARFSAMVSMRGSHKPRSARRAVLGRRGLAPGGGAALATFQVSTSRHRVHREIDALRARAGMLPWRHAVALTDAA
jgi:hypothetical protein